MSDAPAPGLRPLHGFERLFAAAGFPVALVVTLGGAHFMTRAGAEPLVALVVMITLHYTFLAVAERRIPWHRSWLHDRGDLRTDIGLFAVNSLIGGVAAGAFLAAVAVLAGWLASSVGLGIWPTGWPILLQLPLALVVAELVEYSVHRAMHEVPWLWRLHATHHSAPRLYWLNAVRFHPIDLFLVGAGKLVPLVLLGAAEPLFAFVNLFSGVHGSYQHANVPVRIGPLNWIFSMTELHRWHHSPRMQEANHNYGGNLIVWDVIFGTRWLPADREPPETIGIESQPNFPMGFWANLVAPFRWRKVVAESRPAP
ncbi:MAG: sterol desaturase family protein [Myxococcota bacterium]|nr:sterol desaturase family protein [Myxococcota bacterium]